MTWDKEEIAEWSERTFPRLSKEQQLEKLELECREFERATTHAERLEEKADVYIVAVILAERFSSTFAQVLATNLLLAQDDRKEFLEAVDIKMDINASRTWDLINGEYRHVD